MSNINETKKKTKCKNKNTKITTTSSDFCHVQQEKPHNNSYRENIHNTVNEILRFKIQSRGTKPNRIVKTP